MRDEKSDIEITPHAALQSLYHVVQSHRLFGVPESRLIFAIRRARQALTWPNYKDGPEADLVALEYLYLAVTAYQAGVGVESAFRRAIEGAAIALGPESIRTQRQEPRWSSAGYSPPSMVKWPPITPVRDTAS